MLSLLQKTFLIQEFDAQKREELKYFGFEFNVSPTGSRHLGEIKTSTNDEN